MLKFFASYAKAKAAADAAAGDAIALDLGFALADDERSVRMTLSAGDEPMAAAFAERVLSAAEFSDLVTKLNVIRAQLTEL